MDFLALFISAKLMGRTVRPLKLALAASAGAVYALTAVIAEQYIKGGAWVAAYALISAGFAVLMVKCAFGGGVKDTLRASLAYGGVNVGLGGIMTVIYGIVGRLSAGSTAAYAPSPESSPILFCLIAAVSGAVSLIYGKYRKRSVLRRQVKASVSALGREISLTLLCDSGNLLRDPFEEKPVVIVSAQMLRDVLPEEIMLAAEKPELMLQAENPLRGVRLIPAGGVCGRTVLFGFVPDSLTVDGAHIEAVIAVDTGNGGYDGCDGIISPEALSV